MQFVTMMKKTLTVHVKTVSSLIQNNDVSVPLVIRLEVANYKIQGERTNPLFRFDLNSQGTISSFQINDNGQCDDFNECKNSNKVCPKSYNVCENTEGSFECKCKYSQWFKVLSEDCISEEILTV